MQGGGGQAQARGYCPHQIVGAGGVIDQTAQPGPCKAADLMGHEDHAEQHGEMPGAEHLRHNAGSQRHSGQPEQAQGSTEYDGRSIVDRDQ